MVLELYIQYWIASAILAAVNLGVADIVDDEPREIGAIAKRVGADADCLLRLLRALASVGIFREQTAGHFVHTPRSTALRKDHPANEGALIRMLGIKSVREAMSEYENAIRTGRSAHEFVHGTPNPFDILASRPDEAAAYHEGMSIDGEVVSQILERCDFSGLRNIVDVGGGRGTLLARILQNDPDKRGVLFDLPEVVSQHVLGEYNVLERCEVRSGDLRVEVPTGGDGYILKNILHGLPDDECVELLGRIRSRAAANARIFIIENVMGMHNRLDFAKVFDLFLLLGGRRSRVRSEREFRDVLVRASCECVGVRQVFQSQGVIEGKFA
jgi:hypothetical protein